jgi:pimeloyl-ACP methyl ester carboxylesterase
MHGFSLDTRMWDDQFFEYSKLYQVIRYDLRGFGKSSLPATTYSHTTDLLKIIRHLNLKSISLVGLSRGGRWAIQFTQEYPELVDTLVVSSAMPYGFSLNNENRPSNTSVLKKVAKEQGLSAAKALWLSDALFRHTGNLPNVRRKLEAMVHDYSGWHWLNNDPVHYNKIFSLVELENVTCPSLILIGDQDIDLFQEAAKLLKKRIQRSKLTIFPSVGHLANMESPNLFNKEVLSFFQGNINAKKS